MTTVRSWALVVGLATFSTLHAAGGHHAVDDAAILEPGTCEVEGWYKHAGTGERLAHAGVGCRVGPVELSAAGEHAHVAAGTETAYGVQMKWAAEIVPGLSAGFAAAPVWQAHVAPRYLGATASGLLTWAAREDLAFHANLGRDFFHGAPDEKRYGAAIEWLPATGWSLMAERYFEAATHAVRAGARWAIAENVSVDLSRAHTLNGPRPSHWTLGATWLIDRR